MKYLLKAAAPDPPGLEAARGRIVDAVFLAVLIIGAPVLVASVAYGFMVQWTLDPVIQFVVYLLALAVYLLRSRLSVSLRSRILITGFFAVGGVSLVSWGLGGVGSVVLLVFVVLTLILLGPRAGIAALVILAVAGAAVAVAFVMGLVPLVSDTAATMRSPWTWLLNIMGMFFMAALAAVTIWRLYGFLIASFDQARLRGAELDALVRERTEELTKANERLQYSEERLRSIINASRDGIIIADVASKRFVFANRRAGEMLGCTPDQVKNLGVDSIHPPAERAMVVEQFERLARGEMEIAMNIPVLRLDGSVLYADISASPLELDGKPHLLGLFRDTTERRALESALRREKERAQKYLDIAATMFVVINADETVALINRRGAQILGYDAAEIIGANWFDLVIPPAQRGIVRETFGKIICGDMAAVEYFENPVLTKNGSERLIAWHNTTIFDEQGRVTATLSSGEDITDERAAQEALRESELRHRMVTEMMSDYVFHITVRADGSSTMDYVSANYTEITGRQPDELTDPTQWTDAIHHEDLPRVMNALGAIVLRGGSVEIECRTFLKDGRMRWVQVVAKAEIGSVGRVTGILGAVKDITDRILARDIIKQKNEELEATNEELEASMEEAVRANQDLVAANRQIEESEMRYRSIVEANPLGMHLYRLEPDGRLIFTGANPAADRILGVSNAPFVGKTIEEAFPPLAETPIPEAYRRVCRTGEPWRDQQVNYQDERIVGAYEVLAFRVSPGRVAVTFQDVTERLRAEETIRRSLSEKETLLKEIHHRVKNNMQVISSLLSLQMSGITDEHYRELYRDSQKRIRAMALVHEKLYQSENLSQINFKEYITSLVGDLGRSSLVEERQVEIRCELPEMQLDIDRTIPCGLLINEIVTNSLKHAFPPGSTGIVTVTMSLDPEQGYRLTVSDNGRGLPADFDIQRSKTLGMQLITTLASQLRGKVSIERTSGTSITVTFPR